VSAAGTARHLQPRPGIVTGAGDLVEAEFVKDHWDAAREPGPLVTRCRNRTVAKADPISGWWCAGGSSARPGCSRSRRRKGESAGK
jgi:hypothetical protein